MSDLPSELAEHHKEGEGESSKSYMKKSQITYKAKVLRMTANFSAVTERTDDTGVRALQC